MALTKNAYKRIIVKAINDRKFLDALLKNPRRALEKAGFVVTDKFIRRLKHAFKQKRRISGSEFLRMGNKFSKGVPPPPPPWVLRGFNITTRER